jgi:Cysteine-rich secretory protein family
MAPLQYLQPTKLDSGPRSQGALVRTGLWWLKTSMKSFLVISSCLALALCGPAFGQSTPSTPAEMISSYRLQHGEGRVTSDATLNRIAHEQAAAMAAKDVMDHSVLGPFSSRVAPSKAHRSAENIAYGYDSFSKTLDQWINSFGHRQNLLLHEATKVGVASAKSTKTGRTYWAMVIAGEYERPRSPSSKTTKSKHDEGACRLEFVGLCLPDDLSE